MPSTKTFCYKKVRALSPALQRKSNQIALVTRLNFMTEREILALGDSRRYPTVYSAGGRLSVMYYNIISIRMSQCTHIYSQTVCVDEYLLCDKDF